jgi:para-nitrobenzyl esterase
MMNQPALRVVILLSLVLLLSGCGKAAPEVIANGETLKGEWDKALSDVAVFRGIPFAAPPSGELRWRAPQPPVPRTGTVDAIEFATACPQGSYIVDWYARVAEAFGHGPEVVAGPKGESEDCLYLNIWTPDLAPEQPLPVMVYVHGGSNRGGWSYEPNYLGEQLAARGVVVVTIAYRLGPLGFFSHPALGSGEVEPIANFGLLDIEAAFKWVRAHISNFGGAADNITGFGESSGAGNLLDLALMTDQESPLFDRIIAQSTGGGIDRRRSLEQEQAVAAKLLAELGFDQSVNAEQLRNISPGDLLRAGDDALEGHYYQAVVDGNTGLRQPMEGLLGPQAAKLNVLAGTNKDEWRMYVDADAGSEDVEQWIRDSAPEFLGNLLDIVSDETDARRALDRLISAKRMLCPTRFIAGRATAAGGEGSVYWFTRQREGQVGETLGVYHGAELPYVFNQHDAWLPTTDADRAVTETLMSYWVSYASTGSVRTENLPEWPMYSASRPWVMELGDQVGVIEPPDAWLCKYLSP